MDLGADLVGIAPVSRYRGAPPRVNPAAHLPEARSVVVMAIHHPDGSVDWSGEPNGNFAAGFQIGMIPKLDTMSLRMSRFIENAGYATVPMLCTYYWRHRKYKDVPYDHAASFSHMNAFVLAGLGEYGWHGMVMSPRYGPRQRLISVITDAPLEPDPLYRSAPVCDRCNLCEKACWGHNYIPAHRLDPETIRFTVEGKTFEYANINRWRCFWGEQCHLDMRRLEEQAHMGEAEIYAAMDSGVRRMSVGGAGYMCTSFKHCMSSGVRLWDREYAPNPRRRKAARSSTSADQMSLVRDTAAAAGADRCTITPLSQFEHLKAEFYDGFRVEPFYRSFTWVITLGRSWRGCGPTDHPLHRLNSASPRSMSRGRLMAGILDVARALDDRGYEAMQMFGNGFARHAATLAGWNLNEDAVTEGAVWTDLCAMSFQFVSYQATREVFWAAQDLAASLESMGFRAWPMLELDPTAIGRPSYNMTLPDLHAQSPFAVAAGLGVLGKSGLLITARHGPRQRLAFVVTDAELSTVTVAHPVPVCPAECEACASACPVEALNSRATEMVVVTARQSFPVFQRQHTRCEWSRVLGMHPGAGSALHGWSVPSLPVPDRLDDEQRRAALERKDPIQRRCYGKPNHADTQVERCLQACPLPDNQ